MNSTLMSLALCCFLTPPVETSETAETLLYVSTTPPGAVVVLDGKETLGKSNGLFRVPEGVHEIVVKIGEQTADSRKIEIRAGRVTRVTFELVKQPGVAPAPKTVLEPTKWTCSNHPQIRHRQLGKCPLCEMNLIPVASGADGYSFGPVIEQILVMPDVDEDNPVFELLDIDSGRRVIVKNPNHYHPDEYRHWVREMRVDIAGVVTPSKPVSIGVGFFDASVIDYPRINWETITAREAIEDRGLNKIYPPPIKLVLNHKRKLLPKTCLFKTREGTVGVLQVLGPAEVDGGVKIRYKLVEQTVPELLMILEKSLPELVKDQDGKRRRHFVRIVVSKDGMTFEGRKTTWEKLPDLLREVPRRWETVLEIGIGTNELTVKQRNDAVSRAMALAHKFGFEYPSDIGVQKPGSKGTPSETITLQAAAVR